MSSVRRRTRPEQPPIPAQDTRNANAGTERGRAALRDSLARLGAGRPILADRDGQLIAGNKTAAAAEEAGFRFRYIPMEPDEIIVGQRTDLDLDSTTDRRARELALADNRVAELNLAWVGEEIAALEAEGVDLARWFTEGELERILTAAARPARDLTDADPRTDEADALARHWQTAPGQTWLIPSRHGPDPHRLAIGSATSPRDVRRAAPYPVDAMITDPPYGVSIGDKNTHLNEGLTVRSNRIQENLEGDALEREALQALIQNALTFAPLKPGGVFYVFSPAGPAELWFRLAIDAAPNYRLSQCLVWVKQHFVIGRQDYHWRHESILYGWAEGAAHHFIDDRTQNTVADSTPDPRSMTKAELTAEIHRLRALLPQDDVFYQDKPHASGLHPTVKPTALVARLIRNSTRPGDRVYDPFVGSGTTIVACEAEHRTCAALELTPKYAAVTLQRLQDIGLTPELHRPRRNTPR